jgi:muramoyltetrapeptide carboxypeptidase LdcA involved in peptidoglycan recycling
VWGGFKSMLLIRPVQDKRIKNSSKWYIGSANKPIYQQTGVPYDK